MGPGWLHKNPSIPILTALLWTRGWVLCTLGAPACQRGMAAGQREYGARHVLVVTSWSSLWRGEFP